MVADQPVLVYPESEGAEKEVTKKNMDSLYDDWVKKKNGEKVSGQKIQLGDYLRNGLTNK